MKDKELIEQMEALEDIIDWLEKKDESDLHEAEDLELVDEAELEQWLKSPKLKKVRQWINQGKE
jgi:hypothetical protein